MGWPRWLTPFIAIAIVLRLLDAPALLVFVCSALGTVPAAAAMSSATEELAARSGPTVGGLLNVTFGNAPELLIALFALNKGLDEFVKATIVGSIVGNVLLVTGAAMFVGGWGRDGQTFNRSGASSQARLLLIAATALALPTIAELVRGRSLPAPGAAAVHLGGTVQTLAALVAVLLVGGYVASLAVSLSSGRQRAGEDDKPRWSTRTALLVLGVAAIAVAAMSELVVGSVVKAAHALGLTEFFIGAIVVAIVGNVAEHWVAVSVARKDKLDLSLQISLGSGVQVAMLVAPVLVLASLAIGARPLGFVLNGYELAALVLSAAAANVVTRHGASRWTTGLGLIVLYAAVAIVFACA